MAPNKQLLAAWEDGVQLGIAWWVFADNENKKRFRERHNEGRHVRLQLQYTLEVDLIARLEAGRLQAYGIEEGSDTGPIWIAKYYFSKTAKFDYIRDTVAALGKKFYEVRVQGEREPTEETPPSEREVSINPEVVIDPCEISAELERKREREALEDTRPSAPTASSEPHEVAGQEEGEPRHQTLPSEPTRASEPQEFTVPIVPEPGPDLPSSEASQPRDPGRPSKSSEIERAIEILLANGVGLAKLPRPMAYREVRECAARELSSDTQIGFSDPVIQRSLLKRFGPRR